MSAKSKRDDLRSVVVRRLSSARYPLAMAGVIALGYGIVSGGFILPALLYAAMIAVAALGPRRSRAERIRERLDRFRAKERQKRPSLASVLDALPDPIMEVTPEGTIGRANAAAREAFGNELNGLPLFVRFRSPALRDLVAKADQSGNARAMEQAEAFGTDGLYSVHAAVARPRGGERSARERRVVLTFREQTRELREARTRTDFVANASHELRTPLTSLLGFVETLRGPAREDAAARDRFLEIMQQQAQRMARLVDDLLALSRAERESARRPRGVIDIASTVRRAADLLRPGVEAEGVALDVDVETGPMHVLGDDDALVQVITNLVENAARYGRSGGRVHLTATRQGRSVRVSVRDWGEGIEPIHLPRLTERFYRADTERSRAKGGTGLGLAIVKHILARHGSRLRMESKLGAGSTFWFELLEVIE